MKACDIEGCSSEAAYGTRTRTAYCDAHLAENLAAGGIQSLEPVRSLTGHYLMRCLRCGCEAHYRFATHLEYQARDELTCRACFWFNWTVESITLSAYRAPTPTDQEIQERCRGSGYAWLESLAAPLIGVFAYRVQCTKCARIRIARDGDIGWGCSCRANNQSSIARSSQGTQKALFKDSGKPEVQLWDHAKNSEHDWRTATVRAHRLSHWLCPRCGESFTRKVYWIFYSSLCPTCEEADRQSRDAYWAEMKTKTIADFPELVEAFDEEIDPRLVPLTGSTLYRFKCPKPNSTHRPRLTPYHFLQEGCDRCKGDETRRRRAESAETDLHPELIAQWHPTKNGNLTITKVRQNSQRWIWWRCVGCGHEWEEQPRTRDKQPRLLCPQCETILDSLAHHFPEIADEWSPYNPTTAFHVRPTAKTTFEPEWICSTNLDHTWTATLASRRNGAGCPECRTVGKSTIELQHFEAAKATFGTAASGNKLKVSRGGVTWTWLVDIIVHPALVIEYDGAYWHRNKMDTDRRKSRDLLEVDYKVVRLRENDLPSLGIEHPRYLELPVYSSAPDPDGTMAKILAWSLGAPQPAEPTQ